MPGWPDTATLLERYAGDDPVRARRKSAAWVRHEAFLLDSPFSRLERIGIIERRRIAAGRLVDRALSQSSTSRARLGAEADRLAAEIAAYMAGVAPDGIATEVVESTAIVARRPISAGIGRRGERDRAVDRRAMRRGNRGRTLARRSGSARLQPSDRNDEVRCGEAGKAGAINRRHWLVRYGIAAAAILRMLSRSFRIPVIGQGLGVLVFLAIFLSAWYGGLGPGLFATLLFDGVVVGGMIHLRRPGHDQDREDPARLPHGWAA